MTSCAATTEILIVAIDDKNIDAVIFSREDLTLNGSGALVIDSPAEHGIVSKDDLAVMGGTYEITAAGHGLSGKDSVRIADGSITITESYEGLEGRQIAVAGGEILLAASDDGVNARGDGIDSNGDLRIDGGTVTVSGPSDNGAVAKADE